MPIGFHPLELIAILVIALLIFGPKKLPEMGASIGKSIKEFQKGMKELQEPEKVEEPSPTASSSATSFAALEREIASKRTATAAEMPAAEVHTSTETNID